MPIHVETRDCAALTDADLDEMASMGGAFDIGLLSKAKEDWVLCTTARSDEKLHGFTFSTLERIGGTPVYRGDFRKPYRDDPGTRVPVQTLLDYLEAGETIDDFLQGFPTVSRAQVIAFLEAAKDRLVQSVS